MTDTDIVELYLQRDERAVELSAERYGASLRSLSRKITGTEQDAEECENDVYMQAWQSIPPNEPRGYLFAFLAKIVRNLSINRVMKRKAKKRDALLTELTDELQQCIPAPDELGCRLSEREFGELMDAFLLSLGKEARNVFLRRYWYADSIAEISARYSMSDSKVKSMLLRTRNRLRAYLLKEGYEI